MTTKEEARRCARDGCTCHVSDDARYCSEECRAAAEAGNGSECRCGHAACVASDYAAAAAAPRARKTG